MATQEVQVRAAARATDADVKALVEAKLKAAYDKAMATPRPQVAEPFLWWNLYSLGPFQSFAPDGPLPPHQVIKLGETAWITTVLLLNPWPILPPPPGISPCHLLSDFGLSYEIQYQTCNLTTCATGIPSGKQAGSLSPGACWYVNVFEFAPTAVGLFETNISARILGNAPTQTAPHFAGFARWIFDPDPEMFWPGSTPGWQYDFPVKFMVYA
jgi:hypothetical protein